MADLVLCCSHRSSGLFFDQPVLYLKTNAMIVPLYFKDELVLNIGPWVHEDFVKEELETNIKNCVL